MLMMSDEQNQNETKTGNRIIEPTASVITPFYKSLSQLKSKKISLILPARMVHVFSIKR